MALFKQVQSTQIRFCLLFALLSGCSTQPNNSLSSSPYKSDLTESELYLRGTFNWWGVQESYRFLPSGRNEWTAQIDLISDGVAYDFKIATPNWLPQQNCGALDVKRRLEENTPFKLYCNPQSRNFQFTPQDDGQYKFKIVKSDDIYSLSVTVVN